MKISNTNKMNIYNTDIQHAINSSDVPIERKLTEGDFVIAGNGDIVTLGPIKKLLVRLLGIEVRDPKRLGELLKKLESSSQRNQNTDYAIEHGFAVLEDSKASLSAKVRKEFDRVKIGPPPPPAPTV